MKRQVYKLKDTTQTDYTTLDPQNLHLFVDESEEVVVVPDASPTVKGIAKLYNDLLASNTDGSVHQKAIVDEFLLYLKKPIERTGYEIAFDRLSIYNAFDVSLITGQIITNNLTGAQKGIVQKMYIKTTSVNPFPAGWVLLGFVKYTASALTIVYAEWVSGSRVEYWLEKPTS